MTFTCSQCGKTFAHRSSLSRHKKVCGGDTRRFACPHCATTFGRASDLKRHVNQSCKRPKRPAVCVLPENPKRALVDYESSEEEDEPLAGPSHRWRAVVEPPSDTESEEESEDEEPKYSESSDDWHTVDEEPWEPEEEASPLTEEPSPLNLDALRDALPWAQYQGMDEEQFGAALEQIGGNPSLILNFPQSAVNNG